MSGGVTDVTAVLMAVQRMAVLASMPVGKSQLHAKVRSLRLGVVPKPKHNPTLTQPYPSPDPALRQT